jgi:SagB-type dehydrogenase family enzyme
MFRESYPLAWTYHLNTCRNELNTLSPQNTDSPQANYKEYLHAKKVYLPEIDLPKANYGDLLYNRSSCRRFSEEPLPLKALANILFAGYGVKKVSLLENSELMERTVPSGGGLYPLEVYVIVTNSVEVDAGVYHYIPTPPLLELVNDVQLPKPFLRQLFMDQPYVADASAIVVVTSIISRSMKKYIERGYRYILFEAGHAVQNMNLMATACHIGSLNIGGFFDLDVCKVLGIDIEEEIPLYAMALGKAEKTAINTRIPK